MTTSYRFPDALVSCEQLEAMLERESLRLYECTTYLHPPRPGDDAPYTVVSGREDFDRGHIAGAAFLDLQAELSDASSPPHLRFTMPAADALAASLARRGIGDDSQVVLYARGAQQWATRVWWMLRAIGFDRVAILDGGWEKWSAESRPTSDREREYPAARLRVHPRPDLFVDRSVVSAAMHRDDTCTINALSAELHRGEVARYGRLGHIPGSSNVPATTLVKPGDNTFVEPDVAAAAFENAGADPARRTIIYCGGGIAATLDAFVMHQLGHENIAVYDASMSEWARDESLPVETG